MKKQILAIVMVVMLIVSAIPMAVSAATTAITFAAENVTADLADGATVKVPVNITENTGYVNAIMTFGWDNTALELTDIEYTNLAPKNAASSAIANTGSQTVNVNDQNKTENTLGTGLAFTLVFKVTSSATAGNYDISVSNASASLNDDPFEIEQVTATGSTVTLKGEEVCTHSNMETIKAVAATCTEKGNNEYFYCPDCKKYFKDSEGKTETTFDAETIPAKGHTPGAAVKENEVKPGCVTEGSYDEVVYCTVCKAEISRDKKTIAATGHDWGEWVVTKEATETEKGSKTRTCKNDPSHTETVDIPVLTHVHTLTVVEGKPATCTEDGVKTYYKCESCGKMFEDATANVEITSEADLVIPKTGHTPSDWIIDKEATAAEKGHRHKVCTVCNETVAEEDYEYVEPTTAAPTTVAPTTETPTATVEPGTTAAPATTVAPTAQPTTAKPKASGDTATPSNANTNSNGTVKTGESSTVFFLFAGIVLLAAAASTVYFIKKRRESN